MGIDTSVTDWHYIVHRWQAPTLGSIYFFNLKSTLSIVRNLVIHLQNPVKMVEGVVTDRMFILFIEVTIILSL